MARLYTDSLYCLSLKKSQAKGNFNEAYVSVNRERVFWLFVFFFTLWGFFVCFGFRVFKMVKREAKLLGQSEEDEEAQVK